MFSTFTLGNQADSEHFLGLSDRYSDTGVFVFFCNSALKYFNFQLILIAKIMQGGISGLSSG